MEIVLDAVGTFLMILFFVVPILGLLLCMCFGLRLSPTFFIVRPLCDRNRAACAAPLLFIIAGEMFAFPFKTYR